MPSGWARGAVGLGSRRRRRGALRGAALNLGAAGEERPGADALVEPGPLLAGCEALLDAVKAPELAAEVVHHVDERRLAGARDHRAAVLERAVVAEDDVQHRLLELSGELAEVLDRPPHA